MKELKYFKSVKLNWDINKLEKALQEVLNIVPFPTSDQIITSQSKVRFSNTDTPEGKQIVERKIIGQTFEKEFENTDSLQNQLCLTKKPEATSDYFKIKLKEQKQIDVRSNGLLEQSELDDYLSELDYNEFIPEFNHTYFKEIYDYFNSIENINIGRIRLIKSYPSSCISWHPDHDDKIHIPIITNTGVRMMVEDECIHMPAGTTTIVRTNQNFHSLMNGGNTLRVHLVIPFLEK
jgi:hypothetical protein